MLVVFCLELSLKLKLTLLPSGPQSCLCSEVAACENTGDNEVDYLTNIFQVKSVYVEWEILSPFLGGKLPGTLCQQP